MLEEKVYTDIEVPHTKKGKFAIVNPREYAATADEEKFDKEASGLRRELNKLYAVTKTLIGFEGPIGISKTTLAHNTQYWNNMAIIPEEAESPGLFLLYQDIPLYGSPFQFDVGLDRKRMMLSANSSTKSVGFDRTIPGDRIFQEMYCGTTLSPHLFTKLGEFLEEIISETGHLNIICLLKASEKTILDRVAKRNREIEMSGKKVILTDSQIESLKAKKLEFLEFMRQYASPSEFDSYKKRQENGAISKEIIFQGASPDYIKRLNELYSTRFLDVLESLRYNGTVVEIDVEPKHNLDARDSKRAMYPLMMALRDATILSLQRRGFRIYNKQDNNGLKIHPPKRVFH